MSGGISKLLEGASRFLRSVWRWSTAVAKYVFDSSRRVDPAVVFHLTVGALFGTVALGVLGWPQAWSFILACALILIVCSFIGFPTIRWSILSNLLKNRVFCWTLWGALALLFAVSGSTIILLIGGIPIGNLKLVDTSTGTSETRIQQPRSETTSSASNERGATQGAALTASVSFFGAVGAALFFFLNREQKERQMEEQARRERDLAELARMDAHFRALAESFESNNVATKVNAAIGLAELATTPDPQWIDAVGQPRVEQLKPLRVSIKAAEESKSIEFELPWPADFRSIKTSRNYPYFERCFRRLVAAQREWSDKNAKEEALNAILLLIVWAKDPQTDEPLLHDAVRILATANASAWESVRESIPSDTMEPDEIVFLCSNVKSLWFGNARSFYALIQDSSGTTLHNLDSQFLLSINPRLVNPILQGNTVPTSNPSAPERALQFQTQALPKIEYFTTIRDLLVEALMELSPPPETSLSFWRSREVVRVTSSFATDEALFNQLMQEILKQRRKVSLHSTNLMFTRLSQANLHGFDLSGTNFLSTDCAGTRFSFSSIRGSQFSFADLTGASFHASRIGLSRFFFSRATASDFSHADLAHVRIQDAELVQSTFCSARFVSLTCERTIFRNTSFELSRHEGSDFKNCDLQNGSLQRSRWAKSNLLNVELLKCFIAGAEFDLGERSSNKFSLFKWWDADFRFHPSSREATPRSFEDFLAFRPIGTINSRRVPVEKARIDENLQSLLEQYVPKPLQ